MEKENTDEIPPVQITTANGPGYVDPNAVTHILPDANGTGSVIGTTGGLIISCVEDALTLAKLFGFI